METKDRLLAFLEENRDRYISGEETAAKLSVSRTAVWKAAEALRKDGYGIEAVPRKGYRLAADTDVLSAAGIRRYLGPGADGLDIHTEYSVSSTNTVLREKAAAGAPEGYVLAAVTQTAGKGRVGRSFFSPADTGLYLSLILRPQRFSALRAQRFTTIAAVAACEAVEEVTGVPAGIKWVNDIYVNGKKVSGILTEASIGLEDGFLEYAVVGIGFNMYPPKDGFPEEIKDRAGAVTDIRVPDGRNLLAAAFLGRFMYYYEAEKNAGDGGAAETEAPGSYVKKYREKSIVTGKDVLVLHASGPERAHAVSIDDECRLVVRYEDGRTETLSSGEISIRI